jgi:hypothetical protein
VRSEQMRQLGNEGNLAHRGAVLVGTRLAGISRRARESCSRTWITPRTKSMSFQVRPSISEIRRPLKRAVATIRRPGGGQAARSRSISARPRTRWRRRTARGRSSGSS